MDQAQAKKTLQELAKREDLKNRICNDCSNPNPQWASISFGVFICLQCAGTHRGFGVHITFVRSISMDTWQEEQLKKMQLGGNGPFREFMRSYSPADKGGYTDSLSPHETYHSWAAAQYREKLEADVAGKSWSPSLPPPGFGVPSRPSSAQGLRKSRTASRAMTGSNLRSDSASPARFSDSPRSTPLDQKAANESYFASLGQANANRPEDLPPSQGGRYQGFGNTPSPQPAAYGLSSASAPTLSDLQENPMAALSKGWSIFSSAVVGAGRAVNENLIQPGVEKVSDPNFQSNVKGYLSEAQKKAADVGSTANEWSKHQFGVDVARSMGDAVGRVNDSFGVTPRGYESLAQQPGGGDGWGSDVYGSTTSPDPHVDSYERGYSDNNSGSTSWAGDSNSTSWSSSAVKPTTTSSSSSVTSKKKTDDWDDDWKDF